MKRIDVDLQAFYGCQMGAYLEGPVRLGFVRSDGYIQETRIRHIEVQAHVGRHVGHDLVLRDGTEDLRVIPSGFVSFGGIAIDGSPAVLIRHREARKDLDIIGMPVAFDACAYRLKIGHDHREAVVHIGGAEVIHAGVLVVDADTGVEMPLAEMKMTLMIDCGTRVE